MPAYRLAVDFEVIEGLGAFTARQRLEVFRIQTPMATGRRGTRAGGTIEVKVVGRWQINHWHDSPVWELRVVEVRRISLR